MQSFAFGLRFPWRSARAPHGPVLSARTVAWAEQHQLLSTPALEKKLRAVDAGTLAAMVYPGAPLDVQQLVADFLGWIFLQDDFFDEHDNAHDPARLGGMLASFIAVLDGLDPPEDAPPPVVALGDIRRRLAALSSAWWMARFSSSMRRYWLGGVLEEARNRHRGIAPSIEKYIDLRMESVGVYPVLDLIEAAYGFTLPPDVTEDALLLELRSLATLAIALANDVFSYEKEVRAGDPHNFVYLLTRHEAHSLEDAFGAVVSAHNDVVAKFDDLARPLEARSVLMRLYIEGHRRWMRGAYDWQMGSKRYAKRAEAQWT